MKKKLLVGLLTVSQLLVAMENQIQELREGAQRSVHLYGPNPWPIYNGLTCVLDPVRNHAICTGSNHEDFNLAVFGFDGDIIGYLVGHTSNATCLATFSDDPDRLISGDTDGNVILWDLNTGLILKKLLIKSVVWSLLSLGKNWVAVGGGSKELTSQLVIWNIATDEQKECTGHTVPIFNFVKSENKNWFASGAGEDPENCETFVWTLDGQRLLEKPLTTGGGTLSVFKDIYLVTGDKEIKFYDSNNYAFNKVAAVDSGQQWVNVIRFTDDNKTMVSGGQDCSAVIYDVSDLNQIKLVARCLGHQSPINDLLIKPKLGQIITISGANRWGGPGNDATVRVWDFQGTCCATSGNQNPPSGLQKLVEIESFNNGTDLALGVAGVTSFCQYEVVVNGEDSAQVQTVREKRVSMEVCQSNKEEVNNKQSNATTGWSTSCNMQ